MKVPIFITRNLLFKRRNVFHFVALCFVLSFPLHVLAEESSDSSVEMETIYVKGKAQNLALPNKELSKEDLESAHAGNLSNFLEHMPGISNASFGEGVGRPVIRGMSANRVKLSVNGASNADVSNMSSDHAPVMDMTNAESVDVIYGPNTLRFGSGAMGGLVNVNDGRFHQQAFDGTRGRVQTSFGSNAASKQFSGSVDIGNANEDLSAGSITHLDLYFRQSDNFSSGDISGLDKEIQSSGTEALGGSIAYNLVDSNKYFMGIALGHTDYEYGIPNPDDIDTKVTPNQTRLDLQGGLLDLSDNIEKWETKLSFVDYMHDELLDGKTEAIFEKSVSELQSTLFLNLSSDWTSTAGVQIKQEDLSVCHDHSGCSKIPDYSSLPWDGSAGTNLLNDTYAGFRFNHSTPMPLSETLDAGVFAIFGKTYGSLSSEFGIRYDSRTISTDPKSILPSYRRDKGDYSDTSFHPVSLSTGWTWDLDNKNVLALNLSRSERAPTADEMFYNGDHHATFSYQLDNLDLEKEIAKSIDLTWRSRFGSLFVDAAVFYYDFKDYIYNDLKSVQDPYHGRDVYRYEQADAIFAGGELTLEYFLQSGWTVFGSLDTVRAQLSGNKNLPRTPPSSLRSGLKWNTGPWTFETDIHHFARQDDVSENETESDSFSTWNVYLAYLSNPGRLSIQELGFHLKGKNLLDEFGVNHTSYLKDFSPVQGRNLEAAVVAKF